MLRIRVIIGVLIGAALLCAIGIRHKSGRAGQVHNEYEAQREFNEWRIFGREVFAHNRMGVFPSNTRLDMSQGQSPREQFRIVGIAVGTQDNEFGLDEDNYDQVGTFRYLLQTKMQSPDPEDRIWFVRSLWAERYPGQLADVKSLAADSDVRVRRAVQERLDKLGE